MEGVARLSFNGAAGFTPLKGGKKIGLSPRRIGFNGAAGFTPLKVTIDKTSSLLCYAVSMEQRVLPR